MRPRASQSGTAIKLSATITWATPDAITYGTPLSSTQLNATTATPVDSAVTLNRSGTAGDTVDFTVSTTYKPTGDVTVTASNGASTVTCSGAVNATTGEGHCKLTFTAAGSWSTSASYPGDANHSCSASSGTTITVNPF